MFGVLQKIIFFERNCKNCQLKFVSFYVHGWSGLEIRIWDHSRIRFDAMCLMAIFKLANKLLLKIVFFKVNTFISVCVKFQYLDIQGFVLEHNISLDSCWRVSFNFIVRSLFWLTGENLTFWTILALGSKFWN